MLSNALWSPNLVGRTPGQSLMHCWGQRSCRGQAGSRKGVKLLRNAVWPPNLVGKTLDQSVTHCWVRGHAGVSQGQPEVKFFRNALWPPNLAERTPDQSVMHRWVKGHAGVSWGQPEGNCLEMRKAIKCSQCYRALCSCRCSSISKGNGAHTTKPSDKIIGVTMPLSCDAMQHAPRPKDLFTEERSKVIDRYRPNLLRGNGYNFVAFCENRFCQN